MNNVENFFDLVKRGKYVKLGDLWFNMDFKERDETFDKILKLDGESLNKLKNTLNRIDKSLYVDIFENYKKSNVIDDFIDNDNSDLNNQKFSVVKAMLDSCKDNPAMLDFFITKIATYPDIEIILPIIKNIDKKIHDKIAEELKKIKQKEKPLTKTKPTATIKSEIVDNDEDIFLPEYMNDYFVDMHISRCKTKAKILTEYYKGLIAGRFPIQIMESLLMQESHNIDHFDDMDDNEDMNDFNEDGFGDHDCGHDHDDDEDENFDGDDD